MNWCAEGGRQDLRRPGLVNTPRFIGGREMPPYPLFQFGAISPHPATRIEPDGKARRSARASGQPVEARVRNGTTQLRLHRIALQGIRKRAEDLLHGGQVRIDV